MRKINWLLIANISASIVIMIIIALLFFNMISNHNGSVYQILEKIAKP
jgi:hypothetical protein